MASSPPIYNLEQYGTNCSEEYSNFYENSKYWIQCLWLIPTLFLLVWIIITTRVRYPSQYSNLPYWILTADCVVSIILILLDLFVVRLFLYFPQLCSKFSTIFINYPIISDIYFPIYNYARVFKTGSQCGMILSRLFCVLIPFGHDEKLRRHIPLFLTIICILPILVVWNTVISEKEVVFWYGGFFVIYHRRVGWVSLSKLHLTFIFVSISFILISSLLLMRHLPIESAVNAERRVITNSIFIIVAFFFQAAFQSFYAFFRYTDWYPRFLVDFQFIIYDVMTVGYPLIFLNFAKEFRNHVFLKSNRKGRTLMELRSMSKPFNNTMPRQESPSPNYDSILA
ncbi:Serpentine receptor class gamma-7 [Caenorhabditis elegans]|uniref:Serpentine receptor class gamma-7 n=1 Tax=Caenorhabditis elegans TaxID=6239 RepID=SRG7_CAEEL|nr:Serpentine receptor class gamma-7 [Caenorhabditis elegans]P54129.1 RecName: Full=Serpentine receptor class gamma-7; Short=Protein srg-7 [Caenorhabditis elegans]CCD65206.1 Serpentine receptor class gamma-7 [Caenorhabditis elegans]|eukprot:NP_498371.1 Serpentine receptor class gamma-7 [Caenorhabditis elegans]